MGGCPQTVNVMKCLIDKTEVLLSTCSHDCIPEVSDGVLVCETLVLKKVSCFKEMFCNRNGAE